MRKIVRRKPKINSKKILTKHLPRKKISKGIMVAAKKRGRIYD